MALSRAGYGSLDDVMGWTPLRMSQVMFIHGKILAMERRDQLAIAALGSRGDPKELRKIMERDG